MRAMINLHHFIGRTWILSLQKTITHYKRSPGFTVHNALWTKNPKPHIKIETGNSIFCALLIYRVTKKGGLVPLVMNKGKVPNDTMLEMSGMGYACISFYYLGFLPYEIV